MVDSNLKDAIRYALGPSIEGTVVAAVSGGPDSMAMFHALCEPRKEYAGFRVEAAHFNHGLRTNYRDTDAVDDLARSFGVPLHFEMENILDLAKKARRSIETVGRERRYAYLQRVANTVGADAIATGHTRDDHIETVLMRILRGADAHGLRGIAHRVGNVVRPMLDVTHEEAIAYCKANRVRYVEDPTNVDCSFFRNHVRHNVLPELRFMFPRIDAALLRIAECARQHFDEAEAATSGRLEHFLHVESLDEWRLQLDAFSGLNDEHRLHLLSCAVAKIGVAGVSRAHFVAMASGTAVDLPGWHVRREHDGLLFMRREPATMHDPRTLDVPGYTGLGGWMFTAVPISASIARQEMRFCTPDTALLAADGPFTVRFARTGDRMQPLGMSGHKKLSDLFIDRKVPRRRRAHVPLIEASGEILWVAGVATSESARVQPHTTHVVRVDASRIGG